MKNLLCFCVMVFLMATAMPAFAQYDLGNFTWGKGDALLDAAMAEDALRGQRLAEDCDKKKAYTLYEQYLKERELDPHQRADVLAHLGVMDMFSTTPRDEDKARAHFEEALKLAGDDFITGDILLARTNYASLLTDNNQKFDAYVKNVEWIRSLEPVSLAAALDKSRPQPEPMLKTINLDTGEETVAPMADAWPEAVPEPTNQKRAELIIKNLQEYMTNQLPDLCVSTAMFTSDPPVSIQRLIKLAPGTPFEEKAKAAMAQAENAKNINESVKEIMDAQTKTEAEAPAK